MAGTLFLCATPIGNLGDMSPRVVETLKSVDVIAAEDTRNSIKLLNHFDIHTAMTSYHEYNKVEKAKHLIDKLLAGQDIALITDAGTPAISDPGEVLVRMCQENGVRVTSLPGPAACITALTMSGRSTRRFAFEAFLPAEKKEHREALARLQAETRTIVLYEAPHRIRRTLAELKEVLGDRQIRICRELTKKYEEVLPMTISGAQEYFAETEPRGEMVLILEGMSEEETLELRRRKWEGLSIREHVEYYMQQGMEEKDAMKEAALDRGVAKREIYRELKV